MENEITPGRVSVENEITPGRVSVENEITPGRVSGENEITPGRVSVEKRRILIISRLNTIGSTWLTFYHAASQKRRS